MAVKALYCKFKKANELAEDELPIDRNKGLTGLFGKRLPYRSSRSSVAGVKSWKATFCRPVQTVNVSSFRANEAAVGRVDKHSILSTLAMNSVLNRKAIIEKLHVCLRCKIAIGDIKISRGQSSKLKRRCVQHKNRFAEVRIIWTGYFKPLSAFVLQQIGRKMNCARGCHRRHGRQWNIIQIKSLRAVKDVLEFFDCDVVSWV